MAKILKIKVGIEVIAGVGKRWVRPPEYPTVDVHNKISIVAEERIGDQASIDGRGGLDAYWIGVVNDEYAAEFLASDDIIEITQEEAETLGAVWAPQSEVITDSRTVAPIVAKLLAAAPEALTLEELDIVNPDTATEGIRKTPAFTTTLAANIAERTV